MILSAILKQFLENKEIYTSPKNFNSELGLIFSIFKIEKYSP
jgi:UDP-N-acetylmuramyl pentapeptide synthase